MLSIMDLVIGLLEGHIFNFDGEVQYQGHTWNVRIDACETDTANEAYTVIFQKLDTPQDK